MHHGGETCKNAIDKSNITIDVDIIKKADVQAEEKADKNTQVHKPQDKTFREILSIKSEAVLFINRMLNLKGSKSLKEQDIELYLQNYITKDYDELQADVIYRVVNKEITDGPVFIIIEHQSSVDKTMAIRMERYADEIKRKVKQESDAKKYKEPIVIKILLYTGEAKWNASLNIEDSKSKLFGKPYNESKIVMMDNYRTPDVELQKQPGALPVILRMEKIRDNEESNQKIERTDFEKLTKDQLQALWIYLENLNKYALNDEEKIKIIKGLNEKEEPNMLRMAEKILKEKEQERIEGRIEGRAEGRIEEKRIMAKKMKKSGLEVSYIMKITNLKADEINKL